MREHNPDLVEEAIRKAGTRYVCPGPKKLLRGVALEACVSNVGAASQESS
jgi:hypothetical protein